MLDLTENSDPPQMSLEESHAFDAIDRDHRSWLRSLLEENERITKERDILQEAYDAERMNAADAIAERNDVQEQLQQLREELEKAVKSHVERHDAWQLAKLEAESVRSELAAKDKVLKDERDRAAIRGDFTTVHRIDSTISKHATINESGEK